MEMVRDNKTGIEYRRSGFSIMISHNGMCIGHVGGGLGSRLSTSLRAIGYWLDPKYHRQGIATRAVKLFLKHCGESSIQACVRSDNIASQRVLEKCGFRQIAIERDSTLVYEWGTPPVVKIITEAPHGSKSNFEMAISEK
jgi:RimJ/RimL family protein N-acetyltransferase